MSESRRNPVSVAAMIDAYHCAIERFEGAASRQAMAVILAWACGDSREPEHVAATLGVNVDVVDRVLRTLADEGIFDLDVPTMGRRGR